MHLLAAILPSGFRGSTFRQRTRRLSFAVRKRKAHWPATVYRPSSGNQVLRPTCARLILATTLQQHWPCNGKRTSSAAAAIEAGYDLERVLTTDDLVKGENVFFAATGITDGVLLRGVRFSPDGATIESIVMRAHSGTVRLIHGEHRVGKLKQIYGEE